uniref:Tumor necrosis factor receptor superfamily member 26-like n=1 Tax=Sus scrofa TaxID=9823 RepID=A0A8D1GQ43_PIG
MAGWRALPALLLFSLQVTVTTSETPRDYSEHEAPSARLSGKGCPAGQYVSQPMAGDPGVVACRPCQPGTFSPYASEETSCLPCALCRKDQEVVTECSPTRDRQCQCKRGHFFCDSTDCEENCFRCQRCEHSAVLRPCNATRDAVCADRPHPQPGDGSTLFIVLGALALLIPGPIVFCCRRRILRLFQWVASRWKGNEHEQGSLVSISRDLPRGDPGGVPGGAGQPQAFPPVSTRGPCGGVCATFSEPCRVCVGRSQSCRLSEAGDRGLCVAPGAGPTAPRPRG